MAEEVMEKTETGTTPPQSVDRRIQDPGLIVTTGEMTRKRSQRTYRRRMARTNIAGGVNEHVGENGDAINKDLGFDGEHDEISEGSFDLLEQAYIDQFRFSPEDARTQVERLQERYGEGNETARKFVKITVDSILSRVTDVPSENGS